MNNEIVSQSADSFLNKMTAEQLDQLFEMSKHAKLCDIVDALKEHGIKTSDSALSRYFKKRRADEAVENGNDVAGAAAVLAEQGRVGKLREGTLEVLRQKFFEMAADHQSVEEARELYDALVREEARVKELELEARKVAALEQQVKLQERRIEVEAMKARAVLGRVQGEVVDTKAVNARSEEKFLSAGGTAGGGVALALLGEGEPPKGGTTCAGVADEVATISAVAVRAEGEPPKGGTTYSDERELARRKPGGPRVRFAGLVEEALGILNRGGDPGERIIESRALLEEAVAGLRNG
jgi:hypothetical protein